jgi:actin-related protein 3
VITFVRSFACSLLLLLLLSSCCGVLSDRPTDRQLVMALLLF